MAQTPVLSLDANKGFNGTTWQDQSGNNNHVQLSSNTTKTTDGVYFDGNINAMLTQTLPLSNFTIYMTVKVAEMDKTLFGNGKPSEYILHYQKNAFYTATQQPFTFFNSNALVLNQNMVITLTRDVNKNGGNVTAYMNGNFLSGFPGSQRRVFNLTNIAGETGFLFKGWIKNICIFNTVHTTAMIKNGSPCGANNTTQWQQIGGQGTDIGVGADGTTWLVGWTKVAGGYTIHKWNGSYWENIPGGAVRIDVGPDGRPWIVNDGGLIFRYNGSGWQQIGGQGRDIGIGADGSVWLVGWTKVAGGYTIHKWNGSYWENIPGGAVRIDVGPDGRPWIVNDAGLIFRYNGSGWDQIGGQGRDIGIDSDGEVWLVGWTSVAGGYTIHKWNGSYWENVPGGFTNISAGKKQVWGTNNGGLIFRK